MIKEQEQWLKNAVTVKEQEWLQKKKKKEPQIDLNMVSLQRNNKNYFKIVSPQKQQNWLLDAVITKK